MRLGQFERRLERLIEGGFARVFRSGLQPVEVGRRLTREMDLRRTVAPRGTLTPNQFVVFLSPGDYKRFQPIEDELITELVAVANEHARDERYIFLGPVSVSMESDRELTPGMVVVDAEMHRETRPREARLVLPDDHVVTLGAASVIIGRLPDCGVVLADRNVSRYHAEVRPRGPSEPGAPAGAAPSGYEIADLGSTNGTTVNGMPVTGSRALRSGDQITVGATTIRFEEQQPEAEDSDERAARRNSRHMSPDGDARSRRPRQTT